MKLRPILFSLLIGVVVQVGLGSLINGLAYFPLHDAASTGTLFEPLVPLVMFALLMGVLSLIIDLIVGWLTGRWGGSARAGALVGALTQLTGGFINGIVALIVLYLVLQQALPDPTSTVRGLTESYNGTLLLIAGVGGAMGWLISSIVGAIVGGIGGRVGVNVRPKE